MANTDLSIGGGPPGTTATSTLPQGGFAPGQLGNTQLGVVAPLNVTAAPQQAEALAQALGKFNQVEQQVGKREAFYQARADYKQGLTNPDAVTDANGAPLFQKNPDGTVKTDKTGKPMWDTSQMAGRSAAFQEGAVSAYAAKAGQAALNDWYTNPNGMAANTIDPDTGDRLPPEEIVKRQHDYLNQRIGPLLNDPVAREAVFPMIQGTLEHTLGTETQYQAAQHQQDAQAGFETEINAVTRYMYKGDGDPNSQATQQAQQNMQSVLEQIAQKYKVSAFNGDQRQMNDAMVEAVGASAKDLKDPSIFDYFDQSHLNPKQQLRVTDLKTAATSEALKQQKLDGQQTWMPQFVQAQHAWDNHQPVADSVFDNAYSKGWISMGEYHTYMDANRAARNYQKDSVTTSSVIASHGGSYASAEYAPLPAQAGKNPEVLTPEKVATQLGIDLDNRFPDKKNQDGTTAPDVAGRFTGQGGLLEMMRDGRVKTMDDRSKALLTKDLSMSDPQDINDAQTIVKWLQQPGNRSVVGMLGLSDTRWDELQATVAKLGSGYSADDIAQNNRNTDPKEAAARVRSGAGTLRDAEETDTNPQVTAGGILGGGWKFNQLEPSSGLAYREWVNKEATRAWASGQYATPQQAYDAAVHRAQGYGTVFRGASGQGVWLPKDKANTDNPGLISQSLQNLQDNIGNLVLTDPFRGPGGYKIIPSGQGSYAIVDDRGMVQQMRNGERAKFSLQDLLEYNTQIELNKGRQNLSAKELANRQQLDQTGGM